MDNLWSGFNTYLFQIKPYKSINYANLGAQVPHPCKDTGSTEM